MKKLNLYAKEWCDLIFEGRNKDYGAYRLRKKAGARYVLALFYVCLLVGVGIGGGVACFYVPRWVNEAGEIDEAILSKLERPEAEMGYEIKLVAGGRGKKKVVAQPATSIKETTPIVTADEILRPQTKAEALQSIKATAEALPSPPDLNEEDDKSLNEVNATLVKSEKIEVLPQFPGGMQALMKWLDEHIAIPSVCVKEGVNGVVEASFIINEEGKAVEVKIEKKLHPMADAVVLHALKTMPKWKPGKQNNKPISVAVLLPITFHL